MFPHCSRVLLAVAESGKDGLGLLLFVLGVVAATVAVAGILRFILDNSPFAQPPPEFRPVEPPTALAPRGDVMLQERTPSRVTLEVDQVDVVVLRPPPRDR